MNIHATVNALQATPLRSYDDLQSGSTAAPPPAPGIYAWWQRPGALPGISGTPHPSLPFELLYVGIAPNGPASKRNLRKRLRDHHRGAIGSSTFRFDLTAFLWEQEGWTPGWTDRPVLPPQQLLALSTWQRNNLALQWTVLPSPWHEEQAVVGFMRPPLNRDHNGSHPLIQLVGEARKQLRSAARANYLSVASTEL